MQAQDTQVGSGPPVRGGAADQGSLQVDPSCPCAADTLPFRFPMCSSSLTLLGAWTLSLSVKRLRNPTALSLSCLLLLEASEKGTKESHRNHLMDASPTNTSSCLCPSSPLQALLTSGHHSHWLRPLTPAQLSIVCSLGDSCPPWCPVLDSSITSWTWTWTNSDLSPESVLSFHLLSYR